MWIAEVFGGWGFKVKDGDAIIEHKNMS